MSLSMMILVSIGLFLVYLGGIWIFSETLKKDPRVAL